MLPPGQLNRLLEKLVAQAAQDEVDPATSTAAYP